MAIGGIAIHGMAMLKNYPSQRFPYDSHGQLD
jgi:hypothetical protein